jgi:pterin-4a-carbinolamine dehydratase
MRRVSDLLESYFREASPKKLISEMHLPTEVPVQPYVCAWETHSDPERFARTYKFESRDRLIDFLNEVLRFEDETGHHGTQRIDFDSVTIEVYTHTVNKITELDQEYTRAADHIYEDILDFGY